MSVNPSQNAALDSPARAQLAAIVPEKALVSRFSDAWLLGGLSIVLYALVFLAKGSSLAAIPAVGKYVGGLPNLVPFLMLLLVFPHYVFSYKFAYFQGRGFIRKNKISLVIIPAAMLVTGALSFLFWATPMETLGWGPGLRSLFQGIGLQGNVDQYREFGPFFLANCYVAIVCISGWHAARQLYGVMLAYAGYTRYPLSDFQRAVIRYHLYAIWLMDVVNMNLEGRDFLFRKLPIHVLGFPKLLVLPLYGLVGATLALFLAQVVYRNYKEKGLLPHAGVWAPLAAFYLWIIPIFYIPEYIIAFPLISHSLQYMPFIYKVEKEKAREERGSSSWSFSFSYALVVAISFFVFDAVPGVVDQFFAPSLSAGAEIAGISVFLFANFHHYCVDYTIWRHGNGIVKSMLAK
jgi:hypothetical protein